MSTLKKVVSLLTSPEKKQGMWVLVLVMGMAILETAGVASIMPFLAVLGNPQMLETNAVLSALYTRAKGLGISTPDDFLIALGIGSFVLIVVSAVYRIFTQYVMNRFIEMRRHSISARLLETYLSQPYEFFLDHHNSEMSKTILSEIDQVIQSVFRPVYNMAAYSLVLICIITLLILVDPLIALLVAGLIGGLYALIFVAIKHRLLNLGAVLVSSNRERFMAAGEALAGIKVIKLLGREFSYLSRFQGHSQQFASTIASQITLSQVPKYAIEALAFGGIIAIMLVLMVTAGGISNGAIGKILPIVGLYTFAAYRLQPAVQAIFQGFASLRYGQDAIDSIHADIQPDNIPEPFPEQVPIALKAKSLIALKHLSYAYPKATKYALIDLNLDIPVGSSVGLVGSTGAGKTTIVDVILGLLRPTKGAITVDGNPVTDEQLRAWQQSLGYVPQDIFLTDASVAENIALGIPNTQIDQKQVEHCARMAQVHEFIANELPNQYETLVGERGVRLSGGQRQRIGIARALYHNPEVLVLDEATSALDTVTERAVMEAIDALTHQKTIIIIAHRLSTVKNCDQIVLLEKGQIKVKGRFEELALADQQFRDMVDKV
jgi:ABC-type multidrug transport system fused ATPase/permease subunit